MDATMPAKHSLGGFANIIINRTLKVTAVEPMHIAEMRSSKISRPAMTDSLWKMETAAVAPAKLRKDGTANQQFAGKFDRNSLKFIQEYLLKCQVFNTSYISDKLKTYSLKFDFQLEI